MKNNLLVRIALLAALIVTPISPALSSLIPVTGSIAVAPQIRPAPAVAQPLATTISDAGVFSYAVVQQPSDQPGYVSSKENRVTEFGLATRYGSQGFLAHNNLAGAKFFNVRVGDTIRVSYRNGTSRTFLVTQVRHLQATRPNSPTSNFVDLDNANVKLSAVELFYQTYGVEGTLVLQTCIANGDALSWGRLFIIGIPSHREINAQ